MSQRIEQEFICIKNRAKVLKHSEALKPVKLGNKILVKKSNFLHFLCENNKTDK